MVSGSVTGFVSEKGKIDQEVQSEHVYTGCPSCTNTSSSYIACGEVVVQAGSALQDHIL